jgi:hypothetical protein
MLSNLTADDLYAVFKAQKGADLFRIVQASLQFGRIGGADERMVTISNNARDALVRIGKESPMNRLRVKKQGVDVDKLSKIVVGPGGLEPPTRRL